MKIKLCAAIVFFISIDGHSQCTLDDTNQVLDLVKKNHPTLRFNKSKIEMFEKRIDTARQRPNPELDLESTVGDSIEGDIYTTSVSLKHTFELGGKRRSRINMAKQLLDADINQAGDQNEDAIVDTVKRLYRLRQVYQLIPLYEESLGSFRKILKTKKGRNSLSPEQRVEFETLELAANDYKLKLSQLNSDKIRLSKHLNFFMGSDCTIPQKILPKDINLNENFNNKVNLENYSKLKVARSNYKLAQANLSFEKANSYPDIQIGPIYEYESVNVRNTNTIGISLTMDLPILNVNSGGRASAAKQVVSASINLKSIEDESKLDLESWVARYNRFKKSLKATISMNQLEKKHQRIESLFRRGIISTSLIIESHRQLIEFTKTRFEFEIGAIEALWNIYKINGQINSKKL